MNRSPEITGSDAPRWSRDQIRAARKVPLPPVLRREGFSLRPRGHGNVELLDHGGILVKDSYWRYPGGEYAGNAIDLFVQVLGRTFNDAMRILLGKTASPVGPLTGPASRVPTGTHPGDHP